MRKLPRLLLIVGLGWTCIVGGTAWADGVTQRVSVSSTGKQGNLASFGGVTGQSMTPDGRYVVFTSDASNLVPKDLNAATDVFLHDRKSGSTRRVSLGANATEANLGSGGGALTADGRLIAFSSDASNLVGGDTNGTTDIFVRNRISGTTRRVNLTSAGRQANGRSFGSAISANGRYVAFASVATNLVPGDTNGSQDIFVRDLEALTTRRVSIRTGGGQANTDSFGPAISANGRFVTFSSEATNLVPGDGNATSDVFVHDLVTSVTERVSVGAGGIEAEPGSFSFGSELSADGRYVSFQSGARNLVAGDTNGATDVFVRDRQRDVTTRVVLAPSGGPTDPGSVGATLSPTGRFVAVSSLGSFEAFIVDRRSGRARLLSVPLDGVSNGFTTSFPLAVSGDGRLVIFQSDAADLIGRDTNGVLDVFARSLRPW